MTCFQYWTSLFSLWHNKLNSFRAAVQNPASLRIPEIEACDVANKIICFASLNFRMCGTNSVVHVQFLVLLTVFMRKSS